jgi:hypothetical protein
VDLQSRELSGVLGAAAGADDHEWIAQSQSVECGAQRPGLPFAHVGERDIRATCVFTGTRPFCLAVPEEDDPTF